ncbi:hypothetical protein D3C78_1209620 [compost metagenome]
MAIDRTDVVPAQLFEQGAGHQHALGVFLGAAGDFPGAGQARQHLLAAFAHAAVGAAGEDLGQVVGQAADIARNRHVVVVEDHQHVGIDFLGVVQRLESHAGGQCAVADHGNGLARIVLQAGGDGHAQGSTDRGAGVTDTKGVVLALGAAREGGQAVLLAQGVHALAATGEDLVRIGLMTDVPHQPVVRGVENVVQGNRQLDDAQAGTEMPAGLTNGIEQLLAQFVSQVLQVGFSQPTQAGRRIGTVEQRRDRAFAGDLLKRRGHQANRYRYEVAAVYLIAVLAAHLS